MKKLVVIDGNALVHRAYHALPPLKTKEGRLVNAVYGFVSILFRVIGELKPNYLTITFDLAGPTFRDLAYKEYKAKRIKPPQELYGQISLIKKLVSSLNIPIYEKKGFEADDIIGTIVSRLKSQSSKLKIIIVTGDLDMLQLIGKNVLVYLPKKGIGRLAVYDRAAVEKRYGLKPKQIVDFKALRGDPSDNIPGVPGIGQKTAIELIKKFGGLKKLYQNISQNNLNPKLEAKLLEYKKEAFFSQYLATIRKDVLIDFDLEKCCWGRFNRSKAIKLLKKLEFNSLIKRLDVI